MRVLVGSMNPVKAAAVRDAFGRFFDEVEVQQLAVESGVSDQPVEDATFQGARNRARALWQRSRQRGLEVDFCVGIEGGIIELSGCWFAFGCMCVRDREGREGIGTSPHFELPQVVVERLLGGAELGEVMDEIVGEHGTKSQGGAIGHFTRGVMDRCDLYVQGLIVALVPFLNRELYFSRAGGEAADAGG